MKKIIVALTILAVLVPTAAQARPGRILPEDWCKLTVSTPSVQIDTTGNKWIKARSVARCDAGSLEGFHANFEIHLALWRQEVNVDESPDQMRAITVYCNQTTSCTAAVRYDAVNNPQRQWLFWNETDVLVTSGLGNDYDAGESEFLVYPAWT